VPLDTMACVSGLCPEGTELDTKRGTMKLAAETQRGTKELREAGNNSEELSSEEEEEDEEEEEEEEEDGDSDHSDNADATCSSEVPEEEGVTVNGDEEEDDDDDEAEEVESEVSSPTPSHAVRTQSVPAVVTGKDWAQTAAEVKAKYARLSAELESPTQPSTTARRRALVGRPTSRPSSACQRSGSWGHFQQSSASQFSGTLVAGLEVVNSRSRPWISSPRRSLAEPGRFIARSGPWTSDQRPGLPAGTDWPRLCKQRWGPHATSGTARSTASSAVSALAQATYEARFTSCSGGNSNAPPGAAALHRGTAAAMDSRRVVSFDNFSKKKQHPLPPFLGAHSREPTKTKDGGSHILSQRGSSNGGGACLLSRAGRVTVAAPSSSSACPRWAQLDNASKHRSRLTGRT